MKIWNRLKKAKTKVAIAALFSLLIASLGLVGANSAILLGSQMNVYAMDTGVDITNTTSSMTTMFVTLIGVMIPLIIIMAYLGIFQDFLAGIAGWFRGFRH